MKELSLEEMKEINGGYSSAGCISAAVALAYTTPMASAMCTTGVGSVLGALMMTAAVFNVYANCW